MSFERHMCGVKEEHGYSQPYMSPAVQGQWVKFSDYEVVEAERDALLKAVKGEVARLRTSALCNGGGMEPYLDGCASVATETADRLEEALAAEENSDGD